MTLVDSMAAEADTFIDLIKANKEILGRLMPRWDNQWRRLEDTCTKASLLLGRLSRDACWCVYNELFLLWLSMPQHISSTHSVGLLSQDSQLSSHIRKKTPLQQTLFTHTQTHMECTWLQCMF